MSLHWPLALLGLLIVAIVALWWWRANRARPSRTNTSGGWGSAQEQQRWRLLPLSLLLLSLVVLVVATARPHATLELPRIEGTVVLAFDNSTSMLATDADPTRVEAAQAFARDFVEQQPSTVNVGVVAFSSGGVVLQEATTRHTAVLDTIDRLAPDGGTSIAQGMFTALSAVVGEPIEITQEALDAGDITLLDVGYHAGAVIVVISDGENRAGFDPVDVAELAANSGVRVFAVGVGDTNGTTIEVDGYTVATKLNEQTLVRVAEVTGGQYLPLAAGVDMDEINDAVDLQLTLRGEQTEITGLVAVAGGLLLLLSAAVSMVWFGRVL